ncbi:hypothetical protein DFP72DRAFT_1039430 [Ephemerocybe angulata]|uniref:Uncharacterized protein n=1 Tax=Ephemerocybe angulata TaxID=980116 RepID=A0A8H6IHF0_9AGAR|nr:hypothetical protein DFP72DRAFT_1039430 [Tulosesus angulatus]
MPVIQDQRDKIGYGNIQARTHATKSVRRPCTQRFHIADPSLVVQHSAAHVSMTHEPTTKGIKERSKVNTAQMDEAIMTGTYIQAPERTQPKAVQWYGAQNNRHRHTLHKGQHRSNLNTNYTHSSLLHFEHKLHSQHKPLLEPDRMSEGTTEREDRRTERKEGRDGAWQTSKLRRPVPLTSPRPHQASVLPFRIPSTHCNASPSPVAPPRNTDKENKIPRTAQNELKETQYNETYVPWRKRRRRTLKLEYLHDVRDTTKRHAMYDRIEVLRDELGEELGEGRYDLGGFYGLEGEDYGLVPRATSIQNVLVTQREQGAKRMGRTRYRTIRLHVVVREAWICGIELRKGEIEEVGETKEKDMEGDMVDAGKEQAHASRSARRVWSCLPPVGRIGKGNVAVVVPLDCDDVGGSTGGRLTSTQPAIHLPLSLLSFFIILGYPRGVSLQTLEEDDSSCPSEQFGADAVYGGEGYGIQQSSLYLHSLGYDNGPSDLRRAVRRGIRSLASGASWLSFELASFS